MKTRKGSRHAAVLTD